MTYLSQLCLANRSPFLTQTTAQGGISILELKLEAPQQFFSSVHVYNNNARTFYCITEYVYDDRREIYVENKTTSPVSQDGEGERANGAH